MTTEELIDCFGCSAHTIIKDSYWLKWQEENAKNIAKELQKRIGIDAEKLFDLACK